MAQTKTFAGSVISGLDKGEAPMKKQYLKIEGRLLLIVFEDINYMALENGQQIPMNLVGQYEMVEEDPEQKPRPGNRQRQCSLLG